MKRFLFILFISINVGIAHAQNLDKKAIIVTKQNDTLIADIKVKLVGRQGSEWVSGSAFDRKVFFSHPTERKFIKSDDIKTMQFEVNGKKVIFLSREQVPEIKTKNALVQQMQTGKLNWYKTFWWDSYNYSENITDHFFLTGQEDYSTGLFTTFKKALKKVTESRPDLIPMIEDAKGFWMADANNAMEKVVTAFNNK